MTNVPAVTVPVTPTKPTTPQALAKLAREIVMNMRDLPDILADYGLDKAAYAEVQKDEHFKRTLESFAIEWNGALKTHERIRLQAAVSLEDAMPDITARMKGDKENLPAVVEAGKLFAKLAGIGEQTQQHASGEKFTINISLGADTKLRFEKDVTPSPLQIDAKDPSNEAPKA